MAGRSVRKHRHPVHCLASSAHLALEDFHFDAHVRVRRQLWKLGPDDGFARPKIDRERTVPLATWVAQAVRGYFTAC